jgi:signal transduction histidine kinase/ActR/RegA family two-component response regulator
LFDLAECVAPIGPATPGSVIYERFQRGPDLLNIAVVDDDGWPLGLIERHDFSLKMGSQFGRSLYAGRSASLVMDPAPRVVDGLVLIDDFTADTLSDCPANLLRGFIVTREGRYAGVGSALSLLQAQSVSLREHAAQAQAALRAKSEFLAVMSHEIRTPLNGVLAVADLVQRQLTQTELRPFVQTIIDSGETLLRLLNDALDLSRAEAGRLELLPAPLRLGGLIEDIEALWRPRALEAGIGYETQMVGDGEAWVMGDAVRLKQILNNLVGNALKFTGSGLVEVRLTAREATDGLKLLVQVRDTGAGIAEDQLQDLFNPFSQTDSGRRAGGGAGLGLSICRQLAEQMGGRVWATSQLGQGSIFYFEAVLAHAADPMAQQAALASPQAGSGAHVLIADDNAANRLVAETLCRMFDCTSETVENGAEAVRLAQGGRFDLILMDIKMPVMDGLEATRRIRGQGGASAAVPIIALTANADPRDAQVYLAAGLDAVVEKPIKPEALLAVMRRVLDQAAARVAA